MPETQEKKKRTQTEASKKAATVREYYKAVENRDKAQVGVDKAAERWNAAEAGVSDARAACEAIGIKIDHAPA